jgi:hypothetical protein
VHGSMSGWKEVRVRRGGRVDGEVQASGTSSVRSGAGGTRPWWSGRWVGAPGWGVGAEGVADDGSEAGKEERPGAHGRLREAGCAGWCGLQE